MPRAVILTDHPWLQTSQLNVHFLARALARRGWDVTFVTARYGPLAGHLAEGYGRFTSGQVVQAPAILPDEDTSRIQTVIVWHRLRGSRPRHWLSASGLRYAGGLPRALRRIIAAADLLLFDAGEPLAFFPLVRDINRRAKTVFRMSDLPEVHPGSAEALANLPMVLESVDYIAVPSESMRERYAGLDKVGVVPHGLELGMYDRCQPSPYGPGPNAVFIGMARLDTGTLERAAALRPGITFHVVGPFREEVAPTRNIVVHGPMPFADTIPFVTHADIGLQFIARQDGADSFSRSLKMVQYTYCRLPIVAPDYVLASGENVMPFDVDDPSSLDLALGRALDFDRTSFKPSGILSWDEVAGDILRAVGLEERPAVTHSALLPA